MSLYKKELETPPSEGKSLTILSPVNGRVHRLDDVPNPLFQQRLFGEGVAIQPFGYQVLAPFDCIIEHFPETRHQLRLKSRQGIKLLIQIGIGSEQLMGEGFKSRLKPGDVVRKGELLLEFDRLKLQRLLPSLLCPVTMINSQKITGIRPHLMQVLAMQDPAMTIYI